MAVFLPLMIITFFCRMRPRKTLLILCTAPSLQCSGCLWVKGLKVDLKFTSLWRLLKLGPGVFSKHNSNGCSFEDWSEDRQRKVGPLAFKPKAATCSTFFREDLYQPKQGLTSCWSSKKPDGSAPLVISWACWLLNMYLQHSTMMVTPGGLTGSPVLFPMSCAVDGSVVHPLYSLQALVPSLLRHEVEVALEKLGLIWDRTYAWDMFLDMMVRHCRHSRTMTCWISRLKMFLHMHIGVIFSLQTGALWQKPLFPL